MNSLLIKPLASIRRWIMLAVCFLLIVGLFTNLVYSQEASGGAATTPEAVGSSTQPAENLPLAPTPEPVTENQFHYNAQGMRDPFVSLIIHNQVPPNLIGLPAMKISELSLQGIQLGMGEIAIILGSDGKVYSMREGDSVLDGKLIEIQQNKIVFEQIIFDAFGREKEKKTIEIYLHRR